MIFDPGSLLKAKADEISAKGGGKLPSLRALCRDYAISFRDLREAAHHFVAEGKLERIPGRSGFYTPGWSVTENERNPNPATLEQRIQSAIERGDFLPGVLMPGRKELCARFHCGLPALAQALNLLEHLGFVYREGRKFRVSGGKSPGERAPMVVVAPTIFVSYPEPFRRFQLAVQRCSESLGWGSPSLHVQKKKGQGQEFLDYPGALILVNPGSLFGDATLKTGLKSRKAPLAWVDFAGGEGFAASRRDIIVNSSSRVAGETMGRYLIQKGYKRIAWLGRRHSDGVPSWASQRLEGLKRSLFKVSKKLHLEEFDTFLNRERPQAGGPRAEKEIADYREANVLPDMMHRMASGRAFGHRMQESIARGAQKLFAHLLGYEFDVWVGCQDGIAAAAAHFLQREKIPEPRPAIIGFDNTPVSALMHFSSYDFPWEEMGVQAVRHFAGIHQSVSSRPRLILPEGRVQERLR